MGRITIFIEKSGFSQTIDIIRKNLGSFGVFHKEPRTFIEKGIKARNL